MATAAPSVLASGYHFGAQSVGSQSTSNASTAEASDASTIFYNPAGLTHLEKSEITVGANIVAPSLKYKNASATYYNSTTAAPGATSGTLADGLTLAPHVYGAYKLNDKVTLGFGAYVPYGSETEYDTDSVLRYNLNKTTLKTFAFEPVVAYKFNEHHSFAVGAIAQYTTAELRKYSDWGTANRNYGGSGYDASAAACAQAGAAANCWDGHAVAKGHDWGFGYQLAWMWDINERSRIGMNYRSKIEHKLKGTADWTADGTLAQAYYSSLITGRGYVPNEKVSLNIMTPESFSVQGMYKATPKWNLFGDITWTRHSRFNTVELIFENTKNVANGQSNKTVMKPNWKNTYKFAVGASYQYSDPLQLRFGVAYDQSPVRDSVMRLSTLPDNDRIWFSFGAKYDINRKHTLRGAYSYIHIKSSSVANSDNSQGGTTVDSGVLAKADFKSHAQIFGLQYTYRFD
ncbi:long-chain fatty acid transport protein [Neisseria perflava]|nr:OmpP1/FadL family transporter [Neisseria perflava]MCP1660061.1 long-chain fatty acid transport protein [Neisseria perflava]MCP1773432.1 long-chain fatty acid transport protein [Neisseria perflava]